MRIKSISIIFLLTSSISLHAISIEKYLPAPTEQRKTIDRHEVMSVLLFSITTIGAYISESNNHCQNFYRSGQRENLSLHVFATASKAFYEGPQDKEALLLLENAFQRALLLATEDKELSMFIQHGEELKKKLLQHFWKSGMRSSCKHS